MKHMTEEMENLGQAIDRVDNLAHSLQLPFADHVHVEQLRALLPEIVSDLKKGFAGVTGKNPWER